MSIDAILKTLQNQGRIRRFEPVLDPDETDYREMWMTAAIHDWLCQSDRKATRDYKANVRAFLKRFVVNKRLIDNEEYMKNWPNADCPDFFELRVQLQPPRENTRVFGGFVKQDGFIILHRKLRSELRSDAAFSKAIKRTAEIWDGLLPGIAMVRSRPFSNCVTGKFFDVKTT